MSSRYEDGWINRGPDGSEYRYSRPHGGWIARYPDGRVRRIFGAEKARAKKAKQDYAERRFRAAIDRLLSGPHQQERLARLIEGLEQVRRGDFGAN